MSVESCGVESDGMPVCSPAGGQYADFSSCVDVVDVTQDSSDPFYGSSSSERRVRLAYKDSPACRTMADYEASFAGSTIARDSTGKPVRYLRVVVDDGTPAGRRLSQLGGDENKMASWRRRLLQSSVMIPVCIRDKDEAPVARAPSGGSLPVFISVLENDPNVPSTLLTASDYFVDPDAGD